MPTLARVEHTYAPRGACLDLFHNRDPELLVAGPAGTGKSRACLEKLHACAIHNPGFQGLIVRKTQVSMTSSALATFKKFVIPEATDTGAVRWYGGSKEEAAAYVYANGSKIMVTGMDKAEKVLSTEFDMIYVQEAIELTVQDWEYLVGRLRSGVMSFQQLIADTNPASEVHWLKQRCNRGDTTIIESRHSDNPIYVNADGSFTTAGEAYIVGKLMKLTGVRRARMLLGKWVSAEGSIFEASWDDARNLIDPFPIPADWPRYWAVDFGYTHPFILQWWAEDTDGRLYLYREIHHSKRLVEDHARHALALCAPLVDPDDDPLTGAREWLEPEPAVIVCDHDAEGRATLEKHLGMGVVGAKKDVLDGLQAVEARMRPAGDGMPRLFIFRDALVEIDEERQEASLPTCTAQEIGGYVWDTRGGMKAKEQPLKANDDGCDAMRYVVADRDLVGDFSVRWL